MKLSFSFFQNGCRSCSRSPEGRLNCVFDCLANKHPVEVRPVDSCFPGSILQKSCNLCKCISPGNLMVCTASDCSRHGLRSHRKRKGQSGSRMSEQDSSEIDSDEDNKNMFKFFISEHFLIFADGEIWRVPLIIILFPNRDPTKTAVKPKFPSLSLTTAPSITTTVYEDESTTDPAALEEPALKSYTVDELEQDDFRCTPNLPFKVECNTCWCSNNGLEPRLCTRIACNPKVYSSQDHQHNR